MNVTMLGTGHALVTDCYNTCFVIHEKDRYFLVDGGGGNGLLRQLKAAAIDWMLVQDIFVTHKHIDHLLGIIWMMRLICQALVRGKYSGEARIYGHDEVISALRDMATKVFSEKETKYIGEKLHLITVKDGEKYSVNQREVTFFDIHSTKEKQFGLSMELDDGEKLTCCGDEPYKPCAEAYARKSKWLLHEAYCLHSQAALFEPYEKHHSTVKDACQVAETLEVQNLLLYHTEDVNLERRKEVYSAEGKTFFSGQLWVPDDLETIEL